MKKLNEKKYTAAIKTIAESLCIMAAEDYGNGNADEEDDAREDYSVTAFEDIKQMMADIPMRAN